jgi:lipopolysaccharide biosynthesis glycosyltransferase
MEIFKLVNEFCEEKGGYCLNETYVGMKNNYTYNCICEKNHKFKLIWHNIKKRKPWCHKCQKNIFENMIRCCAEELIGEVMVKIRPAWLKNPKTNRRLELDCFSEKLKLAIECQGPQHYNKIQKFKMTDTDLKTQK